MSDVAQLEQRFNSLEQSFYKLEHTFEASSKETNEALRQIATEMHDTNKLLGQVITENSYRDEAIRRVDDTIKDHEDRLRKTEGSQAGNKERWKMVGTVSSAIVVGLVGFLFLIARPLVSVDDTAERNTQALERLTDIVERLEAMP